MPRTQASIDEYIQARREMNQAFDDLMDELRKLRSMLNEMRGEGDDR